MLLLVVLATFLTGLIDDTQAPLAEFVVDLVVRDGFADHSGPIVRRKLRCR